MRFGIVSHFILATGLVVFSLDLTYGYYEDFSRSEMRELKEQLAILTNEVSRLADTLSPEPENVSKIQDPVILVSVERVQASGVNVVTLNFTKNVPELYYTLSTYGSIIASGNEVGQEVNGSDGISSFVINCTDLCDSARKFQLSISDVNQSSGVRLEIDNEDYDPKSQLEFTVPKLIIKHEGDLVYDKGEDVTLKVSVPYTAERSLRFSDVRASFKVIDEDGWGFEPRSGDDWIEKHKRKYLKAAETTFTVKTSKHSLSGFLLLSLSFLDLDGPLVKAYKIERSVGLRPSSQRGPFPEDFLTFPGFGSGTGDLTRETLCKEGESCTLTCSAVGGFMTDLRVNKFSANGDWEPYTNISDRLILGYYRKLEWTVQPKVGSQDMKFQCLALTAVSNISRELNLTVLSEDLVIDENRTSLAVQVDEADPQLVNVTLNCTVIGRPLTGAYFSIEILNVEGYSHTSYIYLEGERTLNKDETFVTAKIGRAHV